MKTLEPIKIWTGDGLGQASAVTLTQLKRTPTVALYQRTQKSGAPQGYEVFIVKIVKAGTPQLGGGVVEEDYEVYPRANSFGKTAWAPGSLGHAEKIYENLCQGLKPCDVGEETDGEETPETPTVPRVPGQRGRVKGERPQLTVPVMEFTVKELAELNKVEYPVAFTFIKEATEAKTIKFLRTERRNAKGKESSIFAKV
jgi:hypothetical protein